MSSQLNIPISKIAHQTDIALVGRDVSLLYQKKYSIPEAAELIGIGETNLRAMILDGKIPVLRITAKKMLLLESDLEAFLRGRQVTMKEVNVTVRKQRLPPLSAHVLESGLLRIGKQ